MERVPSDAAAAPAAQPQRKNRNDSLSIHKLNLRDYSFLLLSNWKWFVLSLAVCLGAAWLYIKCTPPTYERSASILIKSKDNNDNDAELIMQEIVTSRNLNLTNEVMNFRTVATAEEVVRRMHLDIDYFKKGTFHNATLYGIDSPVSVRFDSIDNAASASFSLHVRKDGKATISDMVYCGKPIDAKTDVALGTPANTPMGKITISATPAYVQGQTSEYIEVTRTPFNEAAERLRSRIVARVRKGTSIIDLTYTDMSAARAVDILNTLISVYNENWVKDRNQRTISTNEFIKDRLGVIEQELGNVEQNISDYKSEHLMPDVNAVGSMALGQANAAEQQNTALDNQIYMVRYVRDFLTQGIHENELLPSNTGINNGAIEGQIARYNEMLMRRNSHLANSSLQNPLVKDLDNDLAVIRSTILQGLDNEMARLSQQKRSVQSTYGQAVAKVASNPGSAKYLLSVERQQKVKESLYLFLLQKREENELSQAFTAYNNQLIEPPHGSPAPVSPDSRGIYMMAFLLGVAVPGLIIFGREFTNTAVRGRKDLENISVPFLGEIPQHGKMPRSESAVLRQRRSRRKKGETPVLLVKAGSRDVINEAFRVMRTNLELVLGFDNTHHVIMLTSMNPSSGKTFISANLADIMSTLGKKVLAIDLDMRKGSLSRYVGNPREGLTTYLSGSSPTYTGYIKQLDAIDMLPCGKLPPNPTELLMSDRFASMMSELKKEYDYIFLDCPPVEIVADTAIINRYVDRTLFIVRAGLLDRDALPDIEKWYEDRRYNGLTVVLNGTGDGFSHYGYHRYGSRYGYHYGHYGYGYGHEDDKDA